VLRLFRGDHIHLFVNESGSVRVFQRYERVITFGLAKLAAQSYKAEEEATALMDQAIQDEADFGDEKLAKIMNLFSRF
jgi:hypothetical protein